ncbi:DUF6716 putative glycosyltransferase [Serinicoccus kebangsaanensis]|uniref:DUF6716 putative glycosyltransferase n=1 Tax=Serinicoccus kebangsaanensis TaxID=2602069 RepID=UPI00124E892C|nr:DUF6716 putative glycosyltransferase [Serinicoccus kebangsaanensis]
MRVLAVADSDAYLKWAAATVSAATAADPAVDGELLVLRTPVAPSTGQMRTATHGARVARPSLVSVGGLRRRVRQGRPDVVLVATTGPTAEVVARHVVAAAGTRDRPALVTGLPGMALPATPLGVTRRRWCDAFLVHSHRERAAYRQAFAAVGATPRIACTRLPFLAPAPLPRDGAPARVVFAAQSLVPTSRAQRIALLEGLARLGEAGYEVVVKLRVADGERQTHNEAYPLNRLWEQEHATTGHRSDVLHFATGPMADWLTPTSALVTVSSTAALESMALGLPTVVVDDFGVSDDLLNAAFVGSGCLAGLAEIPELLASGGPRLDADWAQANYLHHDPSEVPRLLQQLGDRRATGGLPGPTALAPASWPTYARARLRAGVPLALGSRLARRRPVS